eukprot:5453938-Pyramimonas_sp.AAC.1
MPLSNLTALSAGTPTVDALPAVTSRGWREVSRSVPKCPEVSKSVQACEIGTDDAMASTSVLEVDSIPKYLKLDDELTGDFTEVSMSLLLNSLSLPVNSRQVGDCLGGCVGDVGGCFGDIGGFIGDAVGSI